MFSKDITTFSAPQMTRYNENLCINVLQHFKDQKLGSRKDFRPIKFDSRKERKKILNLP